MDPSSCILKPLETITRLVRAPNFLAAPNSTFAEYMVDNIIRASATNSSISADATVVISQPTWELPCSDNSDIRVVFSLASCTKCWSRTKWCPRVRGSAGATESQTSARLNRAPTTQSATGADQRIQPSVPAYVKVITMQFGSLLSVTVPSVATDLIRRELDRVSTSWELTRTLEVLRYCAAQPTLTDRVAQKTKTSSRAEKLDSILVMAELMCGMINIQPDSFTCALENARRILGSDKPEVLIVGDTLFRVISQRSSNGTIWSHIVSEDTKITPEFSVYTMANENGRIGVGYEFTMQQVTRQALGDKDLPFTNESCFQDSSIDTRVNYIRVGGGTTDKIPIVHVDGCRWSMATPETPPRSTRPSVTLKGSSGSTSQSAALRPL
ncbi:hypothetical protein DPEC_G00378500 [Dallia pectoralis]|nr:hypothetical protein DPEC_G00378500 [Dallia pectoralis]